MLDNRLQNFMIDSWSGISCDLRFLLICLVMKCMCWWEKLVLKNWAVKSWF